jgi:signal transduction histidine kinase
MEAHRAFDAQVLGSILESRVGLEFYRLLDKLPSAAYTCDAEGLITYFNRHALELWGREPVLNDPIDRFCGSFKLFTLDGTPISHDKCWMALALRDQREYNGHEIVIERPDGSHCTALAHANPVLDDSGLVCGAVNILVDITERARAEEIRKQAENALREAARTKDEFLAMLVHELRGPLAPMSSAIHSLKLQSSIPPDVQWAWEVIDRQMAHMNRLVDDLLDLSRMTRNELALRKESTVLEEIVRAGLEAARPFIDARGHALTIEIASDPIQLDADPMRLAQAISNLLHNAAKYTEPGGRIWLAAARAGNEVVVTIRDTGMGVPAEKMPHIFEMFMQVEPSLARSQSGLGIGLALVKRIVELHGGRVEARSDGPGQGSTFTLRFPLATEPGQPRIRRKLDVAPADQPGRGER